MKKPEKQNVDVLICVLSDTHAGGITALFPNRTLWWGRDKEHQRNYTPNAKQERLYETFKKSAEYIKNWRAETKNGKVVLVHNGDAIEGIHHQTTEIVSHVWEDHVDAHYELMYDFFKISGFAKNRGDKLYYTLGTATHTENWEYTIAEYLNADGIFNNLELEINGKLVWFLHHGPTKGKGPNEGNPLRNFLRDIYFSCKKHKERLPDEVFTGHTHTPCYNSYVYDFHTIHGVICPSFQSKTRYANGVSPTERNEIGTAFTVITASGDIRTPYILKVSSETKDTIKI